MYLYSRNEFFGISYTLTHKNVLQLQSLCLLYIHKPVPQWKKKVYVVFLIFILVF